MLMKGKFSIGIAAVCVALIALIAGAGVNGFSRSAAAQEETGNPPLRVLAIGDSLSVDATAHLYDAAKSLGFGEVTVGVLHRGATNDVTLTAHKDSLTAGNQNIYIFNLNNNGEQTVENNISIRNAVRRCAWDYISLQGSGPQAAQSTDSAYPETAFSALKAAFDEILKDDANENANEDYKLAWIMTWAYKEGLLPASGEFATQDEMFAEIAGAVSERVPLKGGDAEDEGIFDLLIPAGTAIQNLRQSFAGDSVTRNGYQLGYGLGRYTASAAYIGAILGDITGLDYIPDSDDFSGFYLPAVIESVNNALENPFAVSESSYRDTPFNKGKYSEINPGLEGWGYWNPTGERFYSRITIASDSKYYAATDKRFTPAELPVGAIIEIAEGYKYRPDAWKENLRQPVESRRDYVNSKYVQITEEWWGENALRALTVTPLVNNAVVFDSAEKTQGLIKIYLPKSAENTLIRLEAGNRVGVISGSNITLKLPEGTDLKSVNVKVITSALSTVSPSTAQNWNLTNPVTVSVTAEDGSVRQYILASTVEETQQPPEETGCNNSASAIGILMSSLAAIGVFLRVKK